MDEAKYMPALMMAAGGILQWFRAFKTAREWQYHVLAVILGAAAFWMVNPVQDFRLWSLACIEFLTVGGGLGWIYGGTFLISNGAKAAAASNLPVTADHVLVPVTNSK